MTTRGVLEDQIAYYRARAAEYDEWWFRKGRYDRGPEFNARWHAETAAVDTALAAWLATRRPRTVLELACGTGLFTRRLAPSVQRVTAVDASPEVLTINRSRVSAENVDYVEADLFSWSPPSRYDAVFFSFWLSHVPEDRFAAFWSMVGGVWGVGGGGGAPPPPGRRGIRRRFGLRSHVDRERPHAPERGRGRGRAKAQRRPKVSHREDFLRPSGARGEAFGTWLDVEARRYRELFYSWGSVAGRSLGGGRVFSLRS
jgi:SAM-dependent methyltransferase